MGGFQGFADGNILSLHSIGVGATGPGGVLLNINDTTDTKVCKLFDEGVMECTLTLIEYCSDASSEDSITAPFCQGREGQWLNTYSIKGIHVKDGFECPPLPPGFCETHPIPDIHPLDPNNPNPLIHGADDFTRRLDNEEEESFHPCPILAQQMHG